MSINISHTHAAIIEYYEELKDILDSNFTNEQQIKIPCINLLRHYSNEINCHFITEYPINLPNKKKVYPDGAMLLKDSDIPLGFFEAKDDKDNLEEQIEKKFQDGYPQTNILFWQPQRVILYQNKEKVMDKSISDDPANFIKVLKAFFEYSDPWIKEWPDAVDEFKETIPSLAVKYSELLEHQMNNNNEFKRSFETFMRDVQDNISPIMDNTSVMEMLIQYLLTRRIFETIFGANQIIKNNQIAIKLEDVIQTLNAQHISVSVDGMLKSTERFYKALEASAKATTNLDEKQSLLIKVYEKFFQGYSVLEADRSGIVYTPQPVVDFMVSSVQDSLEKIYKKTLGEKNVHILDPFVGTGNFILKVMRKIQDEDDINCSKLKHKYEHELHCNEIMLLPYLIACLNIELLYHDITGEYKEFKGICLVDTFDLVESKQIGMFTQDNGKRVEEQIKKSIFVVISNPPYNAGQESESQRNKNRSHKQLEKSIKESYSKSSSARFKGDLYDPYVKAFRFATDKIKENDEGIVCMVTNSSFIHGHQFDGMRKLLKEDYNNLYVYDLGGHPKDNGGLSGKLYNVFGIKVGVAISLLERIKECNDHIVKYAKMDENLTKYQKYQKLNEDVNFANNTIDLQEVAHNDKNMWRSIPLSDSWNNYIPLAKNKAYPESIFYENAPGILTQRDNWVYRYNKEFLIEDMRKATDNYNSTLGAVLVLNPKREEIDPYLNEDIPWSRELKDKVYKQKKAAFQPDEIRICQKRPFAKQYIYFNYHFVDQRGTFQKIYPSDQYWNLVISCNGIRSQKEFQVLACDSLADIHLSPNGQFFPYFLYGKDGVRENITDWALDKFKKHYDDDTITKEDIFLYVYGILHNPNYRNTYKKHLEYELPRIPFVENFYEYVKYGNDLINLHVNYEKQKMCEVKYSWKVPNSYKLPDGVHPKCIDEVPDDERYEVKKMKRRDNTLIYNEFLTLEGIPEKVDEYTLGGRSALDWIVNQYKTTQCNGLKPNKPNDYCKGDKEYIINLIKKIITVSLETNKIVDKMSKDDF